jgi:hypothetical protein
VDNSSGAVGSGAARALDYRQPRDRRRFYLDRGLRKRPRGSASGLSRLMSLPREEAAVKPESLFGDISAMVVGGVAARAYAPGRQTKVTDFFIDHECFVEAIGFLRGQGWVKTRGLVFPNTALGLYGEAWERDGVLIDVIATDQNWGVEFLRILKADVDEPSVVETIDRGLRTLAAAQRYDGQRDLRPGPIAEQTGCPAFVAALRSRRSVSHAARIVRQGCCGRFGAASSIWRRTWR